jgi:UDP-3-O-[3-hydroxymyristoyl] glucosamine N-acyltransferase
MPFRISVIAEWIDGQIDGDDSIEISGLAKIEEAMPGQLSFISNPKYAKHANETKASALLVSKSFPSSEKTLIRVDDPYFAFLNLVKRLHKDDLPGFSGIHPSAILGENIKLGQQCAIGAHVVIGRECSIGNNVTIHPGVVIEDRVTIGDGSIIYANVSIGHRCHIGKDVIIHMGAVIGSDGFGFAFKEGRYHKIPQVGIVVIEDDVEIGANTTIDRATLGETIIKKGVKIDNLIQIAHNVEIGEHTAIAAQAGISGSTKIGKYVKLGGQAGLAGHLTIGDNSAIGAQAGVTKSVAPDTFVSGYPAREHIRAKREEASLARLPELLKNIRKLEQRIAELEEKLKEK